MTVWLSILGVIVILVSGIFGLAAGVFKQSLEDPEFKKHLEFMKKERERKETWKKKINGE